MLVLLQSQFLVAASLEGIHSIKLPKDKQMLLGGIGSISQLSPKGHSMEQHLSECCRVYPFILCPLSNLSTRRFGLFSLYD